MSIWFAWYEIEAAVEILLMYIGKMYFGGHVGNAHGDVVQSTIIRGWGCRLINY